MEQTRPFIPPHSMEAEKSVLGSMLISRSAVEQAVEALTAQDFYLPKHQDIFAAMAAIYVGGGAVDSVTLLAALQQAGTLEALGGAPYITELSLFVPSAANVSHYIHIVSERSVLRQLMEAGATIAREAAAGEKPLETLLNDAERAVFNISMKKSQDTMVHIRETVIACYDKLGERMQHPGQLTGVPTGFAQLDSLTSGLQAGDLIILAARPSMGKTAFSLNIAQNAATRGTAGAADALLGKRGKHAGGAHRRYHRRTAFALRPVPGAHRRRQYLHRRHPGLFRGGGAQQEPPA